MKLLSKLLLGLCALLCPLSFAYAEPSVCPYDIHLSIMYNFLSEPLQLTFDRMYDALWNGQNAVNVPNGVTRNEAEWLVDFIYNEAPELCAYDRWATKVISTPENDLEIQLAYKFPISVQKQFINDVKQETKKFSNKESAKGIRLIYDEIIRRFDYGFVPGEDTQLAYFALKNDKAVCNGYAQTIVMYCHFAGYPCSYIDGQVFDLQNNSANHAWNVALIDEKSIWLDATWDDNGNTSSNNWFGLSTFEMKKTHKPDDEYTPLLETPSALPNLLNDVSYSVHLDVNNSDGFLRGISENEGLTVTEKELNEDEFYSPALVIQNNSNSAIQATISCKLDGYYHLTWEECIFIPYSNLAFRINASFLKNQTGNHEIIWYYDEKELVSFTWNVE